MKKPTKTRGSAPPPTAVPPQNPYEVLGVPPGVTEEQLKLAYYRLAARYHPDRNPGNKEAASRMSEINVAYNALCNLAIRAKVDAVYHTAPQKCKTCGGTGQATRRRGFGKTFKEKCPRCGGAGVV